MSTSDGSTAEYYQLPAGSTELQHLISHRDMNAQIGEIFRACYRYGIASHSSRLRDAKKIRFYIEAEIARLEVSATIPGFDWSSIGGCQGPAAQIDDESDRQKAVEQNGNDGAVYDDPWYGAPEWARFKAQDDDGTWYWFKAKPELQSGIWNSEGLYQYAFDGPHSNPNWRDTLIERP